MIPGSGHRGLGLDGVSLVVAAYLLQEGGIVLSQIDGILVLGIPLGVTDLQRPQVKGLGLSLPALGMAQDAEVVQSLRQVQVFRPSNFSWIFNTCSSRCPVS